MPNWGIALIGVAGIIIGAVINQVRHWLDRKQRFQVMTFEKRLQAHQEAYRLVMSVGEIINQPKTKVNEFAEKILKIDNEVREWLNSNCLYINKRSHRAFISAFFAVSVYGRDVAEQSQTVNKALDHARSEIQRCLKCITEGIGAKYLPETDKQL